MFKLLTPIQLSYCSILAFFFFFFLQRLPLFWSPLLSIFYETSPSVQKQIQPTRIVKSHHLIVNASLKLLFYISSYQIRNPWWIKGLFVKVPKFFPGKHQLLIRQTIKTKCQGCFQHIQHICRAQLGALGVMPIFTQWVQFITHATLLIILLLFFVKWKLGRICICFLLLVVLMLS